MGAMRISQLAERCGVPATTLRFYESEGLLPAGRTSAGYRVYGPDALERLAFIAGAKRLGLELREIGELLAVWQDGVCAQVKADLRPRIAARLALAGRRADELAAFTASLRAALGHLDALADRDGPCDGQCSPPPADAAATTAVADVDAPGRVPVACSLEPGRWRERAGRWHEATAGALHTSIDGGVRLTLPVRRAGGLAELAVAEQECCPFFDFRLHVDGPHVHLEVRAPGEGVALARTLFATRP